MQDVERAGERLHNIAAIEPILGALQLMALGSWQKAKKRRAAVARYEGLLMHSLPWLIPHLPSRAGRRQDAWSAGPERRLILVIGSEHGLCGRFNSSLATYVEQYREQQLAADDQLSLEIALLGGRLERALTARGINAYRAGDLSGVELPTADLAQQLASGWLTRFEEYDIDSVVCLYNGYHGLGSYRPAAEALLPLSLPAQKPREGYQFGPIIETDPLALYGQIAAQWIVLRVYNLLLESAMAEQSTRYQLLESAVQNAARLGDELTSLVQMARQQAITREMQELALGAGLLEST